MSARKYIGPGLLIGGGIAVIGGAFYAFRKAGQTTDAVEEALNATYVPGAAGPTGKMPTVKLRLTHYWPFQQGLTAAQRTMEGKPEDATGGPLYTVEDFLAGKAQYVSLAGDLQGHKGTVWPYGQKILVPWGDKTLVGRVTDTGGHFHGANKVYRAIGAEPIDVCVFSSANHPPQTLVTAQIVPGDNFAKGKAVATAGLKDQTVTAGLVEGYTTDDYEALAGALEAVGGALTADESIAVGWSLRNRAAQRGVPLSDMLGCDRRASTHALQMADSVLGAPHPDPTQGANDYWLPKLQAKLNQLGDIYRAAVSSGDAARAAKYERYAKYGTVDTVRGRLAREGAEITYVVGCVELLRRA